MKKIVIFAIFAIVGLSTINAQKNVVKINPLGLVFGVGELGFERVLNNKTSLEIGLTYASTSISFNNTTSNATGFGAEGKYKFYLSDAKSAPVGWYVAPVVTYANTSAESGNSKGELTLFGAGVLGGYQWLFGGKAKGFALDLSFGAQYVSVSTSGDISSSSIDGFLPKLGLGFGYAFNLKK